MDWTDTRLAAAAPQTTEHFDVLIVGAGISGRRRRLPPDRSSARARRFVVLEAPGELRRHLAHPPLPGHPLRQRPLHLRLPLQALDGRADRHRRRDPQLHGRGHRRERPGRPHPLPAPDHLGRAGRAATTCWTVEATRTDTGEAVRFITPTSCGCARATTATPQGYTPEWPGMDSFKGRIVHPQTWPEDLDYTGKRVRRDRLGRHGRDADPGHRRRRARTSPCCSARRPTSSPGATPTSWPTTLRAARDRRGVDPRDRAPQDPVRPGGVHPPRLRRARGGAAGAAGRRARRSSARTTTSDKHFTPRYRPWQQRIAFVPDGDLFQGDRARARPRSSPTRSSASPKTASC